MKRLVIFIAIAISGAVFLPSLAISEQDGLTLCDEYQELQSAESQAVFTAFQGADDFETASALLRARGADGALPEAVQLRFARAQSQVRDTAASQERRTRLQKIRQLNPSEHCAL